VHKSSVYRIGSRLAIRPASELISQLPEVVGLRYVSERTSELNDGIV